MGHLIKNKSGGSDEILWGEVGGLERKLIIAAVYLVPIKSTRYKNNGEVRRELETDIMKYKQEGNVMVMRDLNS